MSGYDFYLIPGTDVLKNKLGIESKTKLAVAENRYTLITMYLSALTPVPGEFNYTHYLKTHEFLFGDLYDWAGQPRSISISKPEEILKGLSIQYAQPQEIEEKVTSLLKEKNALNWPKMSVDEQAKQLADMMARLWQVHVFRHGNTRTTAVFCIQFAESKGMVINRLHYSAYITYFREALVAATAVFGRFNKSRPEYLEKFVKDSIKFPVREQGIRDKIGEAKKQVEQTGGLPQEQERGEI